MIPLYFLSLKKDMQENTNILMHFLVINIIFIFKLVFNLLLLVEIKFDQVLKIKNKEEENVLITRTIHLN